MTTPLVDAAASPEPARVIYLPDADLAPRKTIDELECEIRELAGHIAAATCRWLLLVAEFDRRSGWAVDGVMSMAHWLSWKCGFGLNAAREHVRVARALEHLPLIRDAFMRGRLSYSKVRAITRVDDPRLERTMLNIAENATGAQIERLVSGYRRAGRLMGGPQQRDPYLRWDYDDDGCVIVKARLSPEEGARFVKAVESIRSEAQRCPARDVSAETCDREIPHECHPAGPRADRDRSSGQLNADALMLVVDRALSAAAGQGDSERFQVMVHVDAETLLTGKLHDDSLCELNNGWALSPQVANLLACDATVVRQIVDADGKVLDVGRRSRVIPRRLRRALATRDRHCRYPGCTAPVAAWHHVWHWIDGGPTDRANLLGLCNHHHHLVHDRGFMIFAGGDETFRFARPDGTPLPENPKAPDIWAQLEREQADLGITEKTITGHWDGDKLDLDYAVEILYMKAPMAEVG